MLAACLYLSCRETGTPRKLKDVATKSYIKGKDIARSVRLITRELNILEDNTFSLYESTGFITILRDSDIQTKE